ncbi:hypothetical protein GOP47_0012132 [Adiantum capillus-veneris]|uniref:Uncharacterized protein n=1 Tax=Adiantum capillus-veneris TaxID=13818 RepID=A0A9D4ZGL3_ADICA|nr:hypothetical protein GOP47_0012132 [Adiantum capillus-veneris]
MEGQDVYTTGESQGVDTAMEKREVFEGQDTVGMNNVEASVTDINKPQDEQTKFDKHGAIEEVMQTTIKAMAG